MRRLLALLALAVSATLLSTPPASAGGPTSVLITDRSTGDATGLYYTSPAYTELDTMLATGEPLTARPSGLGDRTVGLTWLIHDVEPWRTQTVWLDAEGGPVVSSVDDLSGGTTWRRVGEPQVLLQLLDGVLRPGTAPVVVDSAPAATVDPVTVERTVTETVWWSLTGWRWAILGIVLGAGSVLLATAARGRTREREPRQVLVDISS